MIMQYRVVVRKLFDTKNYCMKYSAIYGNFILYIAIEFEESVIAMNLLRSAELILLEVSGRLETVWLTCMYTLMEVSI